MSGGKVLTIDAAGNKVERPISFETVSAAELASFLPGEICSVLETRRFYQFDAASVEARDGIRVLAPAGGGRLLMTAPAMTDAEAAAAIRIATVSQSGLMSATQAADLVAASEITPASHAAGYVPQWGAANTGTLTEGFEAVEQWINSAPTPTGTGLKGQRHYSSGYMYECVATNTWIRTAAETTW